MQLSKNALQEIYGVATIIRDIRGITYGSGIHIHKDLFKQLPNADVIIKKLSEQYGVILAVSIPYDPEMEEDEYYGMDELEIADATGLSLDNHKDMEFIDLILSYGIVVEEEFDDFYHLLEQSLRNDTAVSDDMLIARPRLHTATLKFVSISMPTVQIDDDFYRYRPMRQSSMAFKIISYCLEHAPGQEVTIDTLLKDMPGSAGLKNINEAIRKTSLFKRNDTLAPFVDSSANTITVRNHL